MTEPRKQYRTVRVEQEAFDLLDKLCERLAQRSYSAMPEEMNGRSKPTKVDVMHAALRLLETKMNEEDVGGTIAVENKDNDDE